MTINDNTQDMRGNIVFFQSYGPDPLNRALTKAVQHFTNGPYVHVAIVIDEIGFGTEVIQADRTGIHVSYLPEDHTRFTMCTIQTVNKGSDGRAIPLEQERLEMALKWARKHIGTAYGWLDIVDQGLRVVVPGSTLRLLSNEHYDCSNFATEFLDRAGVMLPETFKYPFNVSPNDLAEWFGLLPYRHRIMP